MFQQLEAFVRETGKVTLTLKMAGDQMAVVVMPGGDSKEAALRQPLVLTASPAALDEGFADALRTFEGAHRSLAEQVSATAEILQAAEKSQAGKAQKALSKGSKPALSAPASSPDDADEGGESDDGESTGEGSGKPQPANVASKSAPAASDAGQTDLLSLL
ncbi:PRTRC system protein E [Paraburkholderia sp. A2WS-5]|uniref:PRTRC system protein E n=1 Tax=unclassified Paraburkholderia TaxID=2615204 RepID=UPI003B7D0DA1